MVEKIFRQSAEFCSEHELWKLNVAHVFFLQETPNPRLTTLTLILTLALSLALALARTLTLTLTVQETKFKEAIRYYEPVVKKQQEGDNILSVPAIVLANLCVAYIMTSQNEEAEELMRRVEKEEERGEPDKQVQHTSCTPPAHLLHTSSHAPHPHLDP